MKLGEALARRADLQTRVTELRNRLTSSARIQEGEKPVEDPAVLLKEFEADADELESLVGRVNRANLGIRMATGARSPRRLHSAAPSTGHLLRRMLTVTTRCRAVRAVRVGSGSLVSRRGPPQRRQAPLTKAELSRRPCRSV